MIQYTEYKHDNGYDVLKISNHWSRKSIKYVFSGEDGTLSWCLNEKCIYTLMDENGKVLSNKVSSDYDYEQLDAETVDNLPMDIISWINQIIIEHIDFLVEKSEKMRNTKSSGSTENKNLQETNQS